jgi:hypothetical protein
MYHDVNNNNNNMAIACLSIGVADGAGAESSPDALAAHDGASCAAAMSHRWQLLLCAPACCSSSHRPLFGNASLTVVFGWAHVDGIGAAVLSGVRGGG